MSILHRRYTYSKSHITKIMIMFEMNEICSSQQTECLSEALKSQRFAFNFRYGVGNIKQIEWNKLWERKVLLILI